MHRACLCRRHLGRRSRNHRDWSLAGQVGRTGRGRPLSSQSHTLHVPFATNDQQPGGRENSTSLTVGVGGRENPPEKPWETALMAVRPQTKELGVQGCAEQVNSQAENILLQCQQRDMQRKTGIADSGDEGETQPRRGEGSERPGAQVRTGDPGTGFSAVTVQDQR